MQLHRKLNQISKTDFIVEMIQTISGMLLVGFLWTHMIFVGSIILGVKMFNTLALFMEQYRLLDATVILIILILAAHVGTVLRRIPSRWQEQKVIWMHAKIIKHNDTWSWLFQAVTGSAMLLLIIIHVVVVVYAGIDAKLSSDRIQSWMLYFYIVLLFLAEYHASVGLYRALVKWGFIKRSSLKKVLTVITILTIGIGLLSLWVFYSLGDSV